MRVRLASGLPRLAAAACLAALAAGCVDAPRRVVGLHGVGGSAMVTDVQVSATELKAGDTVDITVTSRNMSAETITLHFSSGCLTSYLVRDKNGKVVAPIGVVCTANAPVVELLPGEAIENTYQWDGRATVGFGPLLPAGAYTVTGALNASESHAASSPVTLTIVGP